MSRSLLAAATLTLIAGCSGSSLFADGENPGSGGADGGNSTTSNGGTGGNGGDTSTSSNGGAPSSSSNGGAPSSSSNGGAPSTSSVGGMGGMMSSTVTSSSAVTSSSSGGMTMCDHDICATGSALDAMCDPCVGQICANDPFCCGAQMGNWDEICLNQVFSVCQIDCNPNLPSCEMQYMGGVGYYGCTQSGDTCAFGLNAAQSGSCASYCEATGGECLAAFNNQGQCGYGQQLSCNSGTFQSLICECSRGCGGGPACGNGQTCVNGACQ